MVPSHFIRQALRHLAIASLARAMQYVQCQLAQQAAEDAGASAAQPLDPSDISLSCLAPLQAHPNPARALRPTWSDTDSKLATWLEGTTATVPAVPTPTRKRLRRSGNLGPRPAFVSPDAGQRGPQLLPQLQVSVVSLVSGFLRCPESMQLKLVCKTSSERLSTTFVPFGKLVFDEYLLAKLGTFLDIVTVRRLFGTSRSFHWAEASRVNRFRCICGECYSSQSAGRLLGGPNLPDHSNPEHHKYLGLQHPFRFSAHLEQMVQSVYDGLDTDWLEVFYVDSPDMLRFLYWRVMFTNFFVDQLSRQTTKACLADMRGLGYRGDVRALSTLMRARGRDRWALKQYRTMRGVRAHLPLHLCF